MLGYYELVFPQFLGVALGQGHQLLDGGKISSFRRPGPPSAHDTFLATLNLILGTHRQAIDSDEALSSVVVEIIAAVVSGQMIFV